MRKNGVLGSAVGVMFLGFAPAAGPCPRCAEKRSK